MVSASASPARQLVQKHPLPLQQLCRQYLFMICIIFHLSKAASIRPVLQSFIITILILSYVKVIATEQLAQAFIGVKKKNDYLSLQIEI